jgi:hypothetical protein
MLMCAHHGPRHGYQGCCSVDPVLLLSGVRKASLIIVLKLRLKRAINLSYPNTEQRRAHFLIFGTSVQTTLWPEYAFAGISDRALLLQSVCLSLRYHQQED